MRKNGIMAIKDLSAAGSMMRPEDGGEPMEKVRRFLNNNIFIFSVRQGLLLTIPFLIMGSFSLVIMNFPVRMWQVYLASEAGSLFDTFLRGIYQATFGSLGFIFALMISYAYGEEQTVYDNTHVFFRQCHSVLLLHSVIPAGGFPSGGLSGALPLSVLPWPAAGCLMSFTVGFLGITVCIPWELHIILMPPCRALCLRY
mgnify:CR=1 FL=1